MDPDRIFDGAENGSRQDIWLSREMDPGRISGGAENGSR
jgi:hypothetical protein